MLAIISDLHLQHTSQDGVRYRDEEGNARYQTIDRNVDVRALQRFFRMLDERARRCGAERVEIILAGDIFEVHRSPRWFQIEEEKVRPYPETPESEHHEEEPSPSLLKEKTRQILHDIHADNEEFLRQFENFVAHRNYCFCRSPDEHDPEKEKYTLTDTNGEKIYVRAFYIPGNHDRLVNAWEETRLLVREWLGMRTSPRKFDHVLEEELDHEPETYSTRVRHGHEYDAANFPGTLRGGASLNADPEDYEGPCLGDFATIDVATRLALAFRVHNAVTLRAPGGDGDACRRLYAKLLEFDDVRPTSELGNYLLTKARNGTGREAQWLKPALRDVVAAARSSRFLDSELTRLRMGSGLADEVISAAEPILAVTPSGGLYPLIRAVTAIVSLLRDEEGPAEFAVQEPGPAEDFDLVVAGHTHFPDVVPIRREEGAGEGFYIDTGTWRALVPHGQGRFGHLRAYTMAFVYSDHENGQKTEGDEEGEAPDVTPRTLDRRFETWTGHLARPRLEEPEPAERLCPEPREQELQFTELEVRKVPKDPVWWARGAELKLTFGVDGSDCPAWRKTVKEDSATFQIEDCTVPLDQELDGEVWCHAVEEDVAVDDILPWALGRLPREENGNFTEGEGRLVLRDRTTHMILKYHVRPSE